MIERLAIAVVAILLIALAGTAIQRLFRSRSQRLASMTTIAASASDSPQLLVFTSTWCSDCASQHAVIEQSRDSWRNSVEVTYHDAATESDFARQFGIVLVPALVVARADGAIVGIRQGLVDEDRLRSMIEAAA